MKYFNRSRHHLRRKYFRSLLEIRASRSRGCLDDKLSSLWSSRDRQCRRHPEVRRRSPMTFRLTRCRLDELSFPDHKLRTVHLYKDRIRPRTPPSGSCRNTAWAGILIGTCCHRCHKQAENLDFDFIHHGWSKFLLAWMAFHSYGLKCIDLDCW